MLDLGRLEELKQQLLTGEHFSDAMEFFLEHFGESAEFRDLGGPVRPPVLVQVLKTTLSSLAPMEKLASLLIIEVPGRGFHHGCAELSKHFATFFHFDDPGVGLISVAHKRNPANAKFARFTARPLPPDMAPPSAN